MTSQITFDAGILSVQGVIDFQNADACCAQGLSLLVQYSGAVTVNLSAAEEMSSVSVAVLLHWARVLASKGQALQLTRVPEEGRAILQVSGLTEALPETGVQDDHN